MIVLTVSARTARLVARELSERGEIGTSDMERLIATHFDGARVMDDWFPDDGRD